MFWGETIFTNGQQHQRHRTRTPGQGRLSSRFSKRQGRRPRRKRLSSSCSACAEQGGRTVFSRKHGDVNDRQCDCRESSQRITPRCPIRTVVGGFAAFEWLGAACSCGQNKDIPDFGYSFAAPMPKVCLRCMGPPVVNAADRAALFIGGEGVTSGRLTLRVPHRPVLHSCDRRGDNIMLSTDTDPH